MSYHRHKEHSYDLHTRTRGVAAKGLRGHGSRYGKDNIPGRAFAQEIFEGRSKRSQAQDLARFATVTDDVTVWLHSPNRLDLEGIDTPSAQAIFDKRSVRQKAQDLARRAKKTKNLELWAGNVNRYDFDKIDTPGTKGKHVRRFRVMPKKEAEEVKKKHLDKQKELDHQFLDGKISKEEYERKRTEGRKLPTSEQIAQRAKEMFQEKQAKAGLPNITPEKAELAEGGLLQVAREDLMRTESKVDSQVLEYVHNLNSELEPMGFKVVEID
jgi:hypothetical protein